MEANRLRSRIWNKKDKEMVYYEGEPFNYPNLCIGLNGKIYTVGDSCGDGGWCYEMEDCIRLDSTGRLDKNGKEIFEGDIVPIETDQEGISNGVVGFREGSFVIRGLTFCYDFFLFRESTELEVIGNIYENLDIKLSNPELLTKQK